VQPPDCGQVSSQLPAEQSIVHGDELHDPVQLPDEHGHVPPEHETPEREEPVPGSETGGPPFGLPPPPPPPEPPQAMIMKDEKAKQAK
jgi:hypothetical protein